MLARLPQTAPRAPSTAPEYSTRGLSGGVLSKPARNETLRLFRGFRNPHSSIPGKNLTVYHCYDSSDQPQPPQNQSFQKHTFTVKSCTILSGSTFKGAFAPERRKIAEHPALFFFTAYSNVSNLFCCSSDSAFLNLHIISFRMSRLTSHEND